MAVDPKSDKSAEEAHPQPDPRLIPGGAHGSPKPTGMEGLDRADVPSGAVRSEQIRMGERVKP